MKKRIITSIFFCFFCFVQVNSVFALEESVSSKSGRILGIESEAFFDDLQGVQYIYFGRPTCWECIEFEEMLDKAILNNNCVVYYYNTAYWKDFPRYTMILDQYDVDYVPMLVKTVDGVLESVFIYDSDRPEDTLDRLEEFFSKRYGGILQVTSERNLPVQFHTRLLCGTFFVLLFNAIYLLLKRKKLKKYDTKDVPIFIFLNSSLVFLLHLLVVGLGFSYALQYNASPDMSILGRIGTATWLFITPVIYLTIIGIVTNICSEKGRLN